MSTKDRSEKLASGRKKLKKFQERNAQRPLPDPAPWPADTSTITLSTPTMSLSDSITLAPPVSLTPPTSSLTPPSLAPPAPSLSLSNGPTGGSEWDILRRPLTSTEHSRDNSISSNSPFTTHTTHTSPPLTTHNHNSTPLYYGDLYTHSQVPSQTERKHRPLQNDSQTESLSRRLARPSQTDVLSQVHTQTIDILVAEKSGLEGKLHLMEEQLRERQRKVEELSTHLQSTRLKLEEVEREKLGLVEEKTTQVQVLSRVNAQRGELEKTVQRLQEVLDDQRQENTELVSKVTSQAGEFLTLQETNNNLQSKLNMAELLTQQLSSADPSGLVPQMSGSAEQLQHLKAETERLQGVVSGVEEERSQAESDLSALREVMARQQEEATGKVAGLHSRLVESEGERLCLSEQLQEMRQREESQTESLSTEHAQLQHSNHIAMETLHQERDQLQHQLQTQTSDISRLNHLLTELELKLATEERETERLHEEAVDHTSLLATISSDKEALSLAVAQNKRLKEQLVELQEGFVRVSQQNMQLASDLETEKYHVGELQRVIREEEERRTRKEEEENLTVTSAEVASQTELKEEEDEFDGPQFIAQPENIQQLTQQLQNLTNERDQLTLQLQDTLVENEDAKKQLLERREAEGKAEGVREEVQRDEEEERVSHDQEVLSNLQQNFNSLQQCYVAAMSTKADLIEQLELKELTIAKLAGETETIGEYITLYQTQREALRAKGKEKDYFILQLVTEKESLQAQLNELQRLMKQLLSERPSQHHHSNHHHHTLTHHNLTHNTSHPPHPESPLPSSSTSLPLPSSPSSLPLHLRLQSYDTRSATPDSPISMETTSDPRSSPPPSDGTAEQIFNLLEKLKMGGVSETASGAEIMPCACCTGDIIIV